MLKNYLKSAIRFLKNNRVFAGINMAGLTIALAASFIILLYVINEFSYDHCHKNRKNVYRVINDHKDFKMIDDETPYILASTLKTDFPQVQKAANVRNVGLSLRFKDETIQVRPAIAAGSDIFGIFTLPMIAGNPDDSILADRNSIVLSGEIADKVFPGENPMGKEITGTINGRKNLFIVRGVYEDIPVNSTFKPKCLVSSKWTLDQINESRKSYNLPGADVNWTYDFWNTWLLLADGSSPKDLESQFQAFEKKHISEEPHNLYMLQNLSKVYLDSDNIASTGLQGNLKNVKLFSLIALLVVLVASINYIILSTAVSAARGKETGIRKTFGADNRSIRIQLLSESIIYTLLVLPLALILARLGLSFASKLFQTRLDIISSNIPAYILIYVSLTVLIGLFSGFYTSFYLSRLNVVSILKSTLQTGRKRQYVRSALIVVQLVIFSTFVACTLIIRSQYNYALSKDMGYYTRDILTINLGRDFKGYSAFINSIKAIPNVISAAGSIVPLPMQESMLTMFPNTKDPEKQVRIEVFAVDYNFVRTMGIKVLQGREFSEDYGSDLTGSVMLNEKAVKELSIEDPIGQKLAGKTIIGVVKDFNLHSLQSDIPPLFISMTDKYIQQVLVHYRDGTLGNILPFIENEWKKAAPDRPFNYETIESIVKSIYSSEKNLSTIISIFAVFTLLIAAIGLYGLVLFTGRSRRREIGVRKVFGSSVEAIIFSFLKANLVLVLIASVVSVPATIYFMNKWLSNYAFKTDISLWPFLIAFVISSIVVLLTVFTQSYRASRTNPVEALQYE